MPDYDITPKDAEHGGWEPVLGNLHHVLSGKMIMGGIYRNNDGHLPSAPGRVWYEADIDYRWDWRGKHRILLSNDGLIFATYDHYYTLYAIV